MGITSVPYLSRTVVCQQAGLERWEQLTHSNPLYHNCILTLKNAYHAEECEHKNLPCRTCTLYMSMYVPVPVPVARSGDERD